MSANLKQPASGKLKDLGCFRMMIQVQKYQNLSAQTLRSHCRCHSSIIGAMTQARAQLIAKLRLRSARSRNHYLASSALDSARCSAHFDTLFTEFGDPESKGLTSMHSEMLDVTLGTVREPSPSHSTQGTDTRRRLPRRITP